MSAVEYDQQEPRANLDVVGNAFISGKTVVAYDNAGNVTSNKYLDSSTISKVETGVKDALIVGGDSLVPLNQATLRVSVAENRVGINVQDSALGAALTIAKDASTETLGLLVKGTNSNGDATVDIDGNVNIDGGALTTDTAGLNLFNTNATTVNFVGDATTLTIGNGTTSGQNVDIGTASTGITTLDIHTNTIDSTINIGTVADTSTNKSVIVVGGAKSNTANSTFTIQNAQTILDGDLDIDGSDIQSNSQTDN